MHKKPLFSVIIVNYRSAEHLRRALRSLPEAWQWEVIVVNNDRSEEKVLEEWREEGLITLVSSGGNIGFGAAANIGALHATGRFFLFLNPDTLWQWGTFSEIAEFFEKHPKVGVIGAKMVDNSGSSEKWSAGLSLSFFELVRNNIGIPSGKHIWESRRRIGSGWVSGAALFVRKETFIAADGFDERFFLYFEDMDLCHRVRLMGQRVVLYPEVVIRHLGGKSSLSAHLQKREFYRSQRLYFEKHRSRTEAKAVAFLQRFIGSVSKRKA